MSAVPRRLARIPADDLPKLHAQRMLVALARVDIRHLPKGRRGRRALRDRANEILEVEGWNARFRVDYGVLRRDVEVCGRLWAGTRQMPPRATAAAALRRAASPLPDVSAEMEALRAEVARLREAGLAKDALIASVPVLEFRREHGLI